MTSKPSKLTVFSLAELFSFTKSERFKTAWRICRISAKHFNDSVSRFFAEALRMTYKHTNAKSAIDSLFKAIPSALILAHQTAREQNNLIDRLSIKARKREIRRNKKHNIDTDNSFPLDSVLAYLNNPHVLYKPLTRPVSN